MAIEYQDLKEKIKGHSKFTKEHDVNFSFHTWDKMINKDPTSFKLFSEIMERVLNKLQIEKEQEDELRALESGDIPCDFEDCDTSACLKERGNFVCKNHKDICIGCKNDLSQMGCECAYFE
jgi:rRNA pseudouridine-1189 N-methylase Emg1 (Nep1/Mra1 family)